MTRRVAEELARLGVRSSRIGKLRLYLLPELAAQAAVVAERIAAPPGEAMRRGNRRGAYPVEVPGFGPLFIRQYRRGGWLRMVLDKIYFGAGARPLGELLATLEARARGLPVVEALGAAVERIGRLCYRGWLLSRPLEGVTMWEVLGSNARAEQRERALAGAREAIARMHRGGLYHADLNWHNLFWEASGKVTVLDLDQARLYSPPLAGKLIRRNFARLARSSARLARAGAPLGSDEARALGL